MGRVTLIGAGPGDPGLITVKGMQRLAEADVVVYDALANPRLLKYLREGKELIYAGKRGAGESGGYTLSQDEINERLVELAKQGKKVARLKGGDPYLFGRGAEEAAYLGEHGIDCEVVPGITSGIAAPTYAGIPVTHREHASSVTFVTGHEDPGKDDSAVDYAALAGLIKVGGTACFYMSVGRLPQIVATLIGHGLSAQTPAAAVQWGTLSRQRSVKGTLGAIVGLIEREAIGAPAIIVVGKVAGLESKGMDFFTDRPLFGQRVMVTRTRQQASELTQLLEDQGAEVIEAPTIRLLPAEDSEAVDTAIREIAKHDWLILTSPNAVMVLWTRLQAMGLDSRHLGGVRIAAVGKSTSDVLHAQLAIKPDYVPKRAMGLALGQGLIEQFDLSGASIMLMRADIAGGDLAQLLEGAGAVVHEVAAYRTAIVDALPDEALQALKDKRIDWLTFTSSSTARNLVSLLGDERGLLEGVKTASIGPVTSRTMREVCLEVTVEAQPSSLAGLVEGIRRGKA